MREQKSTFVIPPDKYQELAQPDMCYYIVVAKEDEAKVKEAMKHYPEIDVDGYADEFMNIAAVPGEVTFVGARKTPPSPPPAIRLEPRHDNGYSEFINRPIQ